ncbi:MAG: TRAP transporter substrate-binding protein [Burkholderiales bacterium]
MWMTARAKPILVAIFVHALLFVMKAGNAQEVVLKIHHFVPPRAALQVKILIPWTEKITKESAGRIKFQIYPAMQLGGTAPQLLDQARDGIADIVWAVPGFSAGRYPAFEVIELPFMTKTARGSSRALWEYVASNKIAETEFKDVKLLATHVHDRGLFHMVAKPIRSAADLKGQKVRAGTRYTTKMLALLGATPVGMPQPQIADALSKGVIDGCVLPWEIVPASKVHELVKFHSEPDPQSRALYATAFVLAMNPAKYASLPADLRKIIDNNSGAELSTQMGKVWDDAAAPNRKLAEQIGNQINIIPLAELQHWQKIVAPVTDDWVKEVTAKGRDGNALLQSAKQLVQQYDAE